MALSLGQISRSRISFKMQLSANVCQQAKKNTHSLACTQSTTPILSLYLSFARSNAANFTSHWHFKILIGIRRALETLQLLGVLGGAPAGTQLPRPLLTLSPFSSLFSRQFPTIYGSSCSCSKYFGKQGNIAIKFVSNSLKFYCRLASNTQQSHTHTYRR